MQEYVIYTVDGNIGMCAIFGKYTIERLNVFYLYGKV